MGMDAGTMEDLIRVNVSDSGDPLLVKEERLHAAAPVFDEPGEIFERYP